MTSRYLLKPPRTLRQVCRDAGLSPWQCKACNDCGFTELCALDEGTMREVSTPYQRDVSLQRKRDRRPKPNREC